MNTPTEKLRTICMSFAGAEEEPFGGHTKPTWRVRGKIFAMMSENAEDVTFKGQPGAQDVLVNAHPSVFYVPRYVGHRGWIGVRADDPSVDWDELAGLLYESWKMTAPKALTKGLS